MSYIDIKKLLDPQMRRIVTYQAESPAYSGSIRDLSSEEARRRYREERATWNADAPELPRIEATTAPGPRREIPLRLYYPEAESALPLLIYLHGGGWMLGDLDTHDKIMRLLALESGAAVAGIDYALAPEHKFPSQIEECLAASLWLEQNGADLDIDSTRMAIGGDSAGANLSLAVALSLRDQRHDTLKAMLLYYGAFGLKDSLSRRLFGSEEDGLSEQELVHYRDCLLRGPEDLDDPRFNLLAADLSRLPPAFVAAAEFDPLLDDSKALVALMEAQGSYAEFKLYTGVLHGFLHYSRVLTKAREAVAEGARFLREFW